MRHNPRQKICVTLICTVRNEELTIGGFLDSIGNQTRIPDQVVIVDGGSCDNTKSIIKEYAESSDTEIVLLSEPGCNIARGRNVAVANSLFEYIACSDAGCTLDKNWLERILDPFETSSEVDVVFGWYEADKRTNFEAIAASLLFPRKKRVIKKPFGFLASSRSVAFKKQCWKSVGGYPEWLTTAEDTLFDIRLREAGFKIVFAPEAVVYWRVRSNLSSVARQSYSYRKGDGEAGLLMSKFWIPRLSAYVLGAMLLGLSFYNISYAVVLGVLTFIYLVGPAVVVLFRTKLISSVVLVPPLILVHDIPGILGYIVGSVKRRQKKTILREGGG